MYIANQSTFIEDHFKPTNFPIAMAIYIYFNLSSFTSLYISFCSKASYLVIFAS